ncbi:MAG TPA: hypothetical protein VM692_12670 [Gammaproteobacteria bacterium]|nr:hypothetical protein [Gammaproteobacteria bacterium]
MNKADSFVRPDETSPRLDGDEITTECYEGVNLAPSTVASLVTWDVSGLARHEQERLLAASRAPKDIQGGY